MASTSPAAPGLIAAAIHDEGLSILRSDSALKCAALPPRTQGVHPDRPDVSVRMPPNRSDEILTAGEFAIFIIMIIAWRERECAVQVALC